jgi:hypothetical protein
MAAGAYHVDGSAVELRLTTSAVAVAWMKHAVEHAID